MSKTAPQVAVIYNPAAGRGRARRSLQRLKDQLTDLDQTHELLPTQHAGHEKELAADCVRRKIPLIIAAGGDGTISKVADAILHATQTAEETTLMAWPLGSGNDFVANSGSALHREELADTLKRGTIRKIDVGKITLQDPVQEPRHFLNNLGLGLEAEVIEHSTAIRMLRGMPLYLASSLRALLNAKLSDIQLQIDGREETQTLNIAMMSIANGSRTGGGFRLLPDAEIDDGQLDLGILTAPTIPKLLWVLIQAINQKHLNSKWVQQEKATRINLRSNQGLPIHVDGDLLHPCVKQATIEILPKRLQIRVPNELMVGVGRCSENNREREALKVDRLLSHIHEIPLASEIADRCANIRVQLLEKGKAIGPMDTLIAGTALQSGLILVSGNQREFERIPGLKTVSWI